MRLAVTEAMRDIYYQFAKVKGREIVRLRQALFGEDILFDVSDLDDSEEDWRYVLIFFSTALKTPINDCKVIDNKTQLHANKIYFLASDLLLWTKIIDSHTN